MINERELLEKLNGEIAIKLETVNNMKASISMMWQSNVASEYWQREISLVEAELSKLFDIRDFVIDLVEESISKLSNNSNE